MTFFVCFNNKLVANNLSENTTWLPTIANFTWQNSSVVIAKLNNYKQEWIDHMQVISRKTTMQQKQCK